MGGMGLADGLRGSLAEAEEADFTLLLEPHHFADRLLDRHIGVHAVLVIEVDDLDPESLQARHASTAHVGGIAFHAEELTLLAANVTELSGEKHFVATLADGAADQLLVPADAVHVGRVEEGHSAIERV